MTSFIYDPNQPGNDNVRIQFSTADWSKPLNIVHNVDVPDDNGGRLPIYCLFRTHYSFTEPPKIA